MSAKPVLRIVPAPGDEIDKCSLCACAGRCLARNDDDEVTVMSPTNCYLPSTEHRYGQSVYFKEVVREPIRN